MPRNRESVAAVTMAIATALLLMAVRADRASQLFLGRSTGQVGGKAARLAATRRGDGDNVRAVGVRRDESDYRGYYDYDADEPLGDGKESPPAMSKAADQVVCAVVETQVPSLTPSAAEASKTGEEYDESLYEGYDYNAGEPLEGRETLL